MLRRIACQAEAQDDDDDEEDDEEQFLQRYRAQRLQEMAVSPDHVDALINRTAPLIQSIPSVPPPTPTPTQAAGSSTTKAPSSFGRLEAAHTGPELLRLLTEAHAAGAPAVVHVHNPHTLSCRAINDHLASLAPQHAGTRFLHADGECLAFDPATLPLLIAYDGDGEVVDSLPCAGEAMGKGGGGGGSVERGDLVWWLEGVGVIQRVRGGE